MSSFDFEKLVDRRGSSSTKWEKFGADVLPMWVADMDFAAPDFILDKIQERLAHPILGYTDRPDSLNEAFLLWLQKLFGWSIDEEWLVWLPGVVPGLNLGCRVLEPSRNGLLIPTPVYHPFLDLGINAGSPEVRVPMAKEAASNGRWEMDFERMKGALQPNVGALLMCNPQNPTGRAYTPAELNELADFVLHNDLLLVSDEIHCNIILDDTSSHTPIVQLRPDIADRTISLFAATKTYNIPGVSCAVAVIPNEEIRERFKEVRAGLVPGIGPLGFVASEAAFRDTSTWIPELIEHLRGNIELIRARLGPRVQHLEATYLAWLDVSDLNLVDAEAHFAAHGLGINPGEMFDGPGFVRLNFGCPRATLEEGLSRFETAVKAVN